MPTPKRLPLAAATAATAAAATVRPQPTRLPALRPLALAAALAVAATPAGALPEGATLRFGQAQVLPASGGRLDIRQDTLRAGLDWTGFSIAAGERVVITQPGRDAVLVNRVTGHDPSRLFGQLQSNGSVWLLNPRGIVFGRDSQIDVGGLLASTLSIRSDDMAAGRLLLSRLPGDGAAGGGAIQADGRISAPDGSVILVAPSLSQGGRIDARRIGLAAATQVEVDVEGDGLIFFNARNDGSLATRLSQLGTLRADGGTAELRAAGRAGFADTVLNLDGVVQARSIGRREGRIVIDGGDSGISRVAGTLDASGAAAGERGGQLTVLGEKLVLTGSARLDAGGAAGGGGLRVGGDLQGGNADTYRPAQQLVVQAGARLDASATQHGDGGLVVLWSQGATRFAGSADARGGAQGGDGGVVEVSGKGQLDFHGSSDRSAPAGRAGTLLLDPLNLEIAQNAPNLLGTVDNDLDSLNLLFNAQPGSDSRITALAVQNLLAGGDVRLEAVRNITVSSAITVLAANADTHALTLRAGNDVIVSQPISNKGDIVLSASTPGFTYTSPAPASVTTSSTTTGRVLLTADLTSTGGRVALTNNGGTGIHQAGGTITTGTLEVTGGLEIPTALTLALTGNGTTSLGAALSGAGSLTKAGASSTLVLTSTDNSHGSTVVSGGTLQVGAEAALGAGGLTLDGGVLNPTVSFDTARAVVLGAGGGTVLVGDGLQLGLGGLVSGTALVKSGAGTLALTRTAGANSYTGGTTVNRGTLQLSASGAAGTGTIALGANTLDITNAAQIANLVTVTDGAVISSSTGGGTLTNAQPLALVAGTLKLAGGANSTLQVARALQGDATAGQLVEVTGGVVALQASNSQDGTTVSGGTLRLSANDAAGAGTIALGGNTLDITNAAQIANLVTVTDGAVISSSTGGGTLTNAQPLALVAGTLKLAGGANSTLQVARELRGDASAGQVVEVTGGVVALQSGSNSHDSTLVRSGATLAAGADNVLGAGGLTLDGGTLSATAGFDTARAVVVQTAGSIEVGGGGARTLRLDGLVSGGALTKTGSGVLALTNTGNSHASTLVSGGTLQVAADAALGNGSLTLDGGTLQSTAAVDTVSTRALVLGTGGGTVQLDNAVLLRLDGAVSETTAAAATLGGAALATAGAGTLALANAANAYRGGTTIGAGGTLRLSASGAAGTGTIALGANTLDITNAAQIANLVTVADGAVISSSTGGGTLTNAQPLALVAGTLKLAGGANSTLQVARALQGDATAGQLVEVTGGVVALQAANSQDGTTVSGGTLRLSASGAAGTGTIALGANTLDITNAAQIANLVTVADGAVISSSTGGGTLTNAQPLALVAGTLKLAGGANSTLQVARALQGDATAGQLVEVTGGVVALQASNSQDGTTVSGGTLRLSANDAAGAGTIALGGNTLDITNAAQIANLVTVTDGAVISSSTGGGTLTNAQPLALVAGTLKLAGGANSTLQVARELRGDASAGQVVEVTGGVVALQSGSNSHDSTTVTAGTLRLSAGNAAGTGTVALAAGSTLDITGASVIDNLVTLAGAAHITSSSGGGTLSAAQALQLAPGPATLQLSSAGDGAPLQVARNLVGDGTLQQAVAVTGGLVTLAGSNSHDATTVSGGTLAVGADGALGGGSLTLSGGSFAPTASFDSTRAVVLGGGSITLATGVQLGLGGLVSGGALGLAGDGTLVLARAAGANSYTGGTNVGGGTLRLSSSGAAGTGTIALGANTLDITGAAVLANRVTVADGAQITSSSGGGTLASAQGLTLAPGGSTLRLVGSAGGALVVGSNLVGDASAGQVVEVTGGVVALAGTNTHDATTVSGGTLRLGASAAAGSGSITLNGNQLDITGGAVIANALTVADGARITSSSGGGTLSAAAPLALASGAGTLRLSSADAAAPLVVARNLVGDASAQQAIEVTAGLVTLSGSNSQDATTVSGGTLRLAASGAAGSGAISVGANTLDIVAGAVIARDVGLAGGSLTNSSGGARLDGALTLDGAGSVASTGSGLTLAGVVGDLAPGTLTVNAGRVTLRNDNTYRGGTAVAGGTLAIDGSVAGADAGSGTIALGGNVLDIVNGASVANRVTVADGATIRSSSGGGTLSNAQTLNLAAGASTLNLAGGATQPLVVARSLLDHASGLQAVALTGGLVTLAGSNTHDGGTTVGGGATLALAAVGALGSGALTLDDGRLRATASLDTTRALVLGAGGATVEVDNGQTLGLGGALSGAALAKAGGGTLVLSAHNTYAGGTTVAGGTLALSGTLADAGGGSIQLGNRVLDLRDGAAPANAVTVDGGSITNSSGSGRLAGAVTLAGNATLSSTGSGLTLAGAVGESGGVRAVTIAGGRVTLTADNAWRGGTTVTGGTLAVNAAQVPGADAGSGAIALGNGTLDLQGGAVLANAVTVDGGILTSSAGSGRLDGTLTLLGDARLSSSGGSSGLTLAGAIGSANVARNLATSGSVVLLADNSHLGTTTVQGGTLALSGAGADAGASTVLLNAGTLDLRGGATPANAVVASGGAITNSSGSGRLGGSLTLATASTTVSSTGDGLTLAGVVGESGGARALQLTTGRLVLTRDNSHSGGTTLAGGTLVIDGATADAGSGTIALGGNVLDIVNGASVGNALTVADGAHIRSSQGGGTLAARPGDATALTLAAGNSTLTLSATDAGALVIARPLLNHASGLQQVQVQGGVVELAATGSHDGGTTVSAGTLRLAATGAAGSGTIALGGNRLDIVDGASVANALTAADGATIGNSRGAGTLAFNATPVALAADTTLALSSSGAGLVVDRAISAAPADAASARLLVSRSGNGSGVTLQRANSHGGGTTVDAGGRLAIGSAAALGSGALTLDGGTLASTAAFDTTRPLVLGAGGGTVDTTGGGIGLAGTVSGATLTKAGTGTLVLSADNSHTGGTVVDRGTLAISAATVAGADAGSGPVTVGSQTLDLRHGAVLAADLALDGGTLANSAGSGRFDGRLSVQGVSTLSSTGSGLLVNGVIGEAAAGTGLVTQGPVTLTATSTYNGTITIGSGALTLSGAAARAGSGDIVVGANRLDIVDGASVANRVRIGAGGSLANTRGSGTVAADGAVQLSGNARLQVSGDGLTLAAVVSEAAGAPASAVTIGGGGRVTLLAANSQRGDTTVEAGTLVLRGGAAATGSGRLLLGANTLDLADGASLPNRLLVADGATLRNSSGAGTLAAAGGPIALAGGATLHLDSTGTGLLVDRAVDDAGGRASLQVSGAAGQVRLAQAGTLGGTVRVDGGATLVVGAAGALGAAALQLDTAQLQTGTTLSNAITLGSGGATVDTGAASVSFSGVIGGSGGLVKQGSGTLVLQADNSYSGTTTVAGGVLAISGSGADAGSGAIAVGSQVLDLRNGASPAQPVVLGAGGVLRNSAGSGSIAANGSLRLDGDARLEVTATGTGLGVLGAVSETTRAALTVATTATAAVTLAAANGASGGTTVAAGTLRIDTPQGSAGLGTISLGAGTLDLSNGAVVPNPVSVAGGALRNSAGTGTLAGPLVMAGGATLGSSGSGLSLTGEVSGSGVLVSDAGNVTLGHAGNPFDGGLQVSGGSLRLAGGDAVPDTASVTLAGSGRLLLAGNETLGALAGSAATGVDLGSFTLSVGGNGVASRFDGVIAGTGSLRKTGAASLTLAGANSYTGTTTVDQGTLVLAGADERLADASRLVVQGGSVDLGTRRETVAAVLLDGGSITNGNLLSASNFDLRAGTAAAALGGTTPAVGVDKTGAGLVTLAGRNSYTGTTTLAAGTLALDGGGRLAAGSRLVVSAGTLDLGGGAEAVAAVRLDSGSIVNGSLASAGNFDLRAGTVAAALGGGSDAVGLDKTGADTLTLSGANTYRGDTTLRAGRLVLAGGADVLHDAGTLRVAGGTLDTAGHAETVGLLSVQAGTVTGAGGVLRSVQAFDLQAGTVDAVLGGSAGAVKQGPGTVTLAAANQYTGLTRVGAGALVLAGAQRLAAAGTLQVAGGATLTLGGEQALAGLVMAGSLGGTGTLMVPTVELDGGQLGVPLVVTSLGSSGSSSIGADIRAGTLTVRSGTLQLAAADLLADGVQLAVERGATLALAGNETIGALQLRGTLSGPGTLSAATYALDGGRVHSTLGAGALTSTGTSLLDAAAAVSSVDVLGGVFTTGAGGRLTALPAVTVAGGARWALQGDQRIGSLAGAGQVDLAANTLRTGVLGDSRFDGVLGGDGGLVKQGGSRFTLGGANTYTGDTVVEAGTLALAGADRLADATRVQVASGANLALDATDTVAELQLAGTLAGNGQLTAARYLLQSGRSEAALGAGALTSQGESTVAGAARVDSIDVADGRLVLAAPAALTSAPATRLAAGSTLVLQGDATLGSLAGAGELVLDRFTLRTGGGGSSRFDGVLSGDGALEKLGDTRFTLGASQRHTGGTTVLAGTLALDGADRLADAGAVTVAPGAVLALAGDDRVASLALQGTLAGTGTLSAATYALDGGTVLADLGAGTLSARGSSTLAGRSAAGTVDVQAGRLTLAGADRLTDAATLNVAAGATLTLNGPARATHLVLAGTLDGSSTFSAAQTSLQAGTVLADLGGGALDSRGDSRLAGHAAVDSLAVQDGRLTLASAGRLSAAPATEVAAGARLVLGGDETLGRLSGAGDVAIGAFTLRTGAGGSSSFAGAIDGDGGLVKLGADTTFGLTGRNTYRGSTWVAAGTLEVGDGASAGAIDASRDIRVDGTLQFNHADAVLLARPVAGNGGITQAGSGTLTFAGSNKTYTGPTDVRRGALASRGDEALSDASTVQVAAGAALQLGGGETIAALQADGPVQLAGRLSASGALVFNGAATVPGGGPLLLQAAAVDARAAGNDWGSRLSLDVAGEVQLSSGAAGAGLRPLTLGEVQVGGGGRIEAASILLDGATRLRGGTLVLDLQGGEVFVEPGGELLGRLSPANRQIAFTGDLLQQTAATAGTSDAALALQVDAGARLDVQASRGGSVALLNPANRIDGGLSVVLGEAGRAWVPNLVRPAGGTAGTEYSLQNRVRLTAGPLRIAGAGIQADVVLLQADTLATDDGAAIVAKLPFDNQAGTASSLPGLTLVLRDPAAFADSGGETTSTFGSGAVPLRIDVGSISFGNRTELPINGGYVSLQPTVRLGGMGRTTVFLQGPATATGYSFFYDGARRQGTIPVFYNGESAVPPQVSGSIASTLSVSEGARKERFDEAVRTENVALRLRAGVIAEVGPGTPATVNTMPMEGLRPPSCAPAPGSLSCGP